MEAIVEFPFVEGLPVCTVDESRMTRQERLRHRLAMIKAMVESDGQMIPVSLAAELLGVTRQRIHNLINEGTLKKVNIHGVTYVTENSLVEFTQAERKAGRPPKLPSVREMAKAAIKFSRES